MRELPSFTLREYQQQALESVRNEFRAGHRRVLLVLPTGAGKTVTAAGIIQGALDRGNRVLFVAHRRELISQAAEKLEASKIPYGIIQAGEVEERSKPVQVASIQTLARREIPQFDLAIIDEAHRAKAAQYQKLFPLGLVLGLTATPVRLTGGALGEIFDAMVVGPSMSELVEQEHLVRTKVFAPYVPDLSGIGSKRGDYDLDALGKMVGESKVVGDVVATWKRRSADRRSIVFAVDRSHSQKLVAEFVARGVRAVHLDGDSPKSLRSQTLNDLRQHRIDVVSNVGLFCEGLDIPAAETAVLARPTRSLMLYLQMVGRVMRPSAGKDHALVLDHAGNALRHGLPCEHREWSLDAPKKRQMNTTRGVSLKTCTDCYAVLPSTASECPLCEFVFPTTQREIRLASGELVELDAAGLSEARAKSIAKLALSYWKIESERIANGYKPGWSKVQFQRRNGFWPSRAIIEARVEREQKRA